ncbi:hypothetical protein [Acetobacterium carbinolicum]|uniref:hypothetical protein n=1 Tax=Acetobacterium carbinolicum TaxID=52690 RepID=UPI0039C9362F
MKNEKFFNAIGKIDDNSIETASPKSNNREKTIWRKRRLITLITACLIFFISATAYAIENRRYNAAVDYLTSLGIEATDLSNYSRSEIKQAVTFLEAGETNALTAEILSSAENSSSLIDIPITAVTSGQIHDLTPQMTHADIINILGETQDIGSGIYILVYEVDGAYLLNIPLAGNDAQLGVTGETLLKALTPKK